MKRAVDRMATCVVLLDTSAPGFKVMYANDAWEKVTGENRQCSTGMLQGTYSAGRLVTGAAGLDGVCLEAFTSNAHERVTNMFQCCEN